MPDRKCVSCGPPNVTNCDVTVALCKHCAAWPPEYLEERMAKLERFSALADAGRPMFAGPRRKE